MSLYSALLGNHKEEYKVNQHNLLFLTAKKPVQEKQAEKKHAPSLCLKSTYRVRMGCSLMYIDKH